MTCAASGWQVLTYAWTVTTRKAAESQADYSTEFDDMKPIKVRFLGRQEIRMGSPYSVCRASLSGDWVPRLTDDGEGFQDIKAWSPDSQFLALIRWNISSSNEPGFNIIVVSLSDQTIQQSRRRKGCCRSLAWEGGKFVYTAFTEARGSFIPSRYGPKSRS